MHAPWLSVEFTNFLVQLRYRIKCHGRHLISSKLNIREISNGKESREVMAATSSALWPSILIHGSRKLISDSPSSLARSHNNCGSQKRRKLPQSFRVVAITKGSAKSSESEETIPSWARPDSDKPPPWASQDEGKEIPLQKSFEIASYVYLLASAVTAIAAIGSAFEYVNQNPIFGIVKSDSVFYAPLLGFFAFTGIPSAAFLFFRSVETANKEAEEQDKKDGYS